MHAYYEVSAKTGGNVEAVFDDIIRAQRQPAMMNFAAKEFVPVEAHNDDITTMSLRAPFMPSLPISCMFCPVE